MYGEEPSGLLLLHLLVLLVLSSIDFGDDMLQLPFGFALGEVVHVVVLGRRRHQPLGFDWKKQKKFQGECF